MMLRWMALLLAVAVLAGCGTGIKQSTVVDRLNHRFRRGMSIDEVERQVDRSFPMVSEPVRINWPTKDEWRAFVSEHEQESWVHPAVRPETLSTSRLEKLGSDGIWSGPNAIVAQPLPYREPLDGALGRIDMAIKTYFIFDDHDRLARWGYGSGGYVVSFWAPTQ